MGYKGRQTAHGFRSIGSTALNEQQFSPDVIEAALAHIDKNAVRRAYNRSDYLEQRRVMMSWWSEYIEQATNGNVGVRGIKALKIMGN
jgi:integrase